MFYFRICLIYERKPHGKLRNRWEDNNEVDIVGMDWAQRLRIGCVRGLVTTR
jgi:hypothetical protein